MPHRIKSLMSCQVFLSRNHDAFWSASVRSWMLLSHQWYEWNTNLSVHILMNWFSMHSSSTKMSWSSHFDSDRQRANARLSFMASVSTFSSTTCNASKSFILSKATAFRFSANTDAESNLGLEESIETESSSPAERLKTNFRTILPWRWENSFFELLRVFDGGMVGAGGEEAVKSIAGLRQLIGTRRLINTIWR